ncbi:sure-like protein [Stereum hirsutum FP-91666 SS1]|uniref:sure-like protein n=1 Tax=Stereum hirsutum (strain FP-91666) TaxID=721885 RepID=UPI000444A062|nr:sure-like protein [Stereum hirsutum FP-91666 SS1]EIM80637.1 sure-like protein [Stereum hirsutum FP-91666 SS1]
MFSSIASTVALSVLGGVISNALATPVARQPGANILLSNDDGWAVANIRAFYQELVAAGSNTVLSAPAENQSGTGSSTTTPTPLTEEGEFGSIPVGAPAEGHDADDDHIWYVNAYPADSVNYGLNTLAPEFFGAPPSLVVTGPNVGNNLGLATLGSGTVGAATTASLAGVPAIAFSAATGSQVSYTTLTPSDPAFIYASAATNLTSIILSSSGGASSLPADTILNVNYPAAGTGTSCTASSSFTYVLSRVNTALGLPIDVSTCGRSALPTESSVVGTSGCFASVSVVSANTKLDVGKATQAVVLGLIGDSLGCLPS